MTMASLLGLLAWALSAQMADSCLCCWPDVAQYFIYDAKLLVGNPDVAEKLEKLFLGSSGKCDVYGGRFLEREDMEREAGNLFLQLQQIIQKNGKDPERLMTEAGREKQNFSKRLEEVSNTFLKEICNASCEQNRFRPYELVECGDCHLLKAPCNDSLVCAGPNILAGVLVTLVILLGAGGGVWYYRRKKAGEGESKDQEDDGTENVNSSDSSEWSECSEEADVPTVGAPNPAEAGAPDLSSTRSPRYQNVPPPDQNVPPPDQLPTRSPPYENVPPIPSPPHIWSPPS